MPTTTQSWFSQFVAFLESGAQKVESEIVAVAEDVGSVAVQYGEEFLSSLADIALGSVLKQAPLVLSGAEKFGTAVTDVIQYVETQGKTIAINDAHAVVQAAYNKVVQVAGSL